MLTITRIKDFPTAKCPLKSLFAFDSSLSIVHEVLLWRSLTLSLSVQVQECLLLQRLLTQGLRVALVEHGKMGGTCINVGCVPSKMLIYPSDVIAAIHEAGKLGVHATVDSVDFSNIMARMHALVDEDSGHQALAVEATPNLVWLKETGRVHLRLHHAGRSTHDYSPKNLHRFRSTPRVAANQRHR